MGISFWGILSLILKIYIPVLRYSVLRVSILSFMTMQHAVGVATFIKWNDTSILIRPECEDGALLYSLPAERALFY